MGFTPKNQGNEVERSVPIDTNNEQFLLGHALNDPIILEELLNAGHAESFLYINHQAIYDCLKHLFDRGVVINIDTIDAIKGKVNNGLKITLEYLGELKTVFSESVNLETYRVHLEKLQNDKIKDVLSIQLMPSLARMLVHPQVGADTLVREIAKMREYVEDGAVVTDTNFVDAKGVDEEHSLIIIEREKGGTFGSTGYDKLDKKLTDGFAPTKLTVVAGRPGMGKSAIVGNMFLRLGLMGVPVAIYNFEMDRISVYDRMVAIRANVELTKIIKHRNELTSRDLKAEKQAKEEIRELPIHFFKKPTQTMDGVRRDIRIIKEKHGVQLIAYDLFDKMRFISKGNRSTADVLNENLKEIQNMGGEFNIHQILVVQIGRAAEKRKNKRPKISELKDAGGYEERADNILLLFRQSYYENAEEEEKEVTIETLDEVEVIIAKQRQGQTNVKCMFDFFPATTSINEPL